MTTALSLALALLVVGDLLPVAPPVAPPLARGHVSPAPASAPPAPAPTSWSRTDSRGVRWTHADRAHLDSYVDGVERSYAAPASYGVASACANGSCGVAAPRRGFRLFGRR